MNFDQFVRLHDATHNHPMMVRGSAVLAITRDWTRSTTHHPAYYLHLSSGQKLSVCTPLDKLVYLLLGSENEEKEND